MLSGSWWTSEAPSVRLPGSLVRVDGRWRLDLIGTWMVNTGGEGLAVAPPQTIFGACRGRSYSLHNCYLQRYETPHSFDVEDSDDQNQMQWSGGALIEGGHFALDHSFKIASFRMTGLSRWWPSSGLVGRNASKSIEDYKEPTPLQVDAGEGFSISVGVASTERRGRRVRSLQENVRVWVSKDSGFTLSELNQIIGPMRSLVAISNDHPAEVFDLRLGPLLGNLVDPGVNELEDDAYVPGFFNADLHPMDPFIRNWISLARGNIVPMDVAEPRRTEEALQNRVVNAVSAAETLQRMLYPEPSETPNSDLPGRVAAAMSQVGGFNSRDRKKVTTTLSHSSVSLEKRLVQLAEGLGDEVAEWLYKGQVRDWAFVAMQVRNVLSHGFSASHGVEADAGALVGILRLTQATLRLGLIAGAGGPVGQPLLDLIRGDLGYRALAFQEIADWKALRARISPS
ncbi:HEPN domain-containing protein [Streptomyces sp. NPDC002122]|uniref:ApeA N-terminal domain 1-containing protein n=1 Tax=Streptomyces sp. NPDC002122 TaxID=3154407 RepID=UPI00332FE694